MHRHGRITNSVKYVREWLRMTLQWKTWTPKMVPFKCIVARIKCKWRFFIETCSLPTCNRDPTPKQGVWFCYKTNVKMSFFPTVWDLSPTSTSWTGSTSSSFTSKSSCSTALSLFLITLVVFVFLKWFLYSSSICSYPPKRWQHLRFRAFLKAGICHHIHRKQSMMTITPTAGSKMYSFQFNNFEPEIKKRP